jgi:2-deoxy-D-gluconate 3-dehydrogenase
MILDSFKLDGKVARVPGARQELGQGMALAQANEWAQHHIHVNAIAPGYMATDNTAALRADPDRSKAILDRVPAGRWGTPDDLKGVVVFLASSASGYMHGAILPLDGGWLAR